MKILVIGSGGREHALAWKLARSPDAERIFCAPGNAGTAEIAENVAISSDDLKALAQLSDPKPSIDTRGLSPLATEVANRLKHRIKTLDEAALKTILKQIGR